MEIIEKAKKVYEEKKKKIKTAMVVAAGVGAFSVGYIVGTNKTNIKWNCTINRAAFGGGTVLTHTPSGDKYKLAAEKIVEEVTTN